MAKTVRISDDGGSNYYTLPGNEGSLNDEVGSIDDTIFGQNFQSNQPGMIAIGVSANGFYKGFAGYVAKIMKTGTSTAFTTEACSLVTGKEYKIDDITKNIWNRAGTFVVFDNASPVDAADIDNLDYLLGRVTFASGYSVVGAITVTGAYLPYTQIAAGNEFTLTMQANAIDRSTFNLAQANGGTRNYQYGLKTVGLDLSGIFDATNAFRAAVIARTEVVIEINPDGSQLSLARGWFKPSTRSQQGNVGDLEEESISYQLYVPDQSDITVAFKWLFESTSTLNTSIQKAIEEWEAGNKPKIQYLYDGTNGFVGDGVITDISLSGGLEVMNEFKLSAQYDGALTAVP